MPTLFDYMKSTQRLVHDQSVQQIAQGDLKRYVNEARREVAMRAECIRILTPVSGAVTTISVTAGGTGYTAPTVTITTPDFPSGRAPFPNGLQATAIATEVAGTITGINIVQGGDGYYEPVVTINDPTGTGATAEAAVAGINVMAAGQEEYAFADADLSPFPGVGAIYMIKSVSVIYANYRYSLPMYSFSVYQAMIRQYPYQYQYVPTLACQRGQGVNGTFMMYPIASQNYQMEWDCFCLPADMDTDQDVEAIPEPWTDAVPYFAAYRAYLELQNQNAARVMEAQFNSYMTRYGHYTRPGRMTNPYGRY
jgi:hypothetical protein